MWEILLCFGIVFLILEIMMPGIFFLNFAISAIICAILSIYIKSFVVLTITFCVLSVLLIFTLRPLLMKKEDEKKKQTGIEAKYVGKRAKVLEKIDSNSGVISIYDERWQARTKNNEVINENEEAEIIGYESIIMYVKKVSIGE